MQFTHIQTLVKETIERGAPVVSIDGKKKEFLGSLYREGKLWVRKDQELVRWDHDFPFLAEGKVTPFGIYDLEGNHGFMVLGESSETARFVVDSLRLWWRWRGWYDYPDAEEILVLADSGGGCSYRCHLLKEELQQFSDQNGLRVRVAHFPPGCSKWNYIEHRLFPHVSREMRGTVFEDHDQVGQLMERATTKSGLKVRAYHLPGEYPTGEKASKEYLRNPTELHDDTLPKLNYIFHPKEQSGSNAICYYRN
jgi:hypothetical protein